jgi:hypothetical protein
MRRRLRATWQLRHLVSQARLTPFLRYRQCECSATWNRSSYWRCSKIAFGLPRMRRFCVEPATSINRHHNGETVRHLRWHRLCPGFRQTDCIGPEILHIPTILLACSYVGTQTLRVTIRSSVSLLSPLNCCHCIFFKERMPKAFLQECLIM